jgi:hypothetical protein
MVKPSLAVLQPPLTAVRTHWKPVAGALVVLIVVAGWMLAHWLDVPGSVYGPNLSINKDTAAYAQVYLSKRDQGILAWLQQTGGADNLLRIGAAPRELHDLLTPSDLAELPPLRVQLVLDLPEPGSERPVIDHAALVVSVHQHWRSINLRSQSRGWFHAQAGGAAVYRGRYLHGPQGGPFVTVVNNAVVLATDTLAAFQAIDALLDHRYVTRDSDPMLRHTLSASAIPGNHQLTFSLSNRDSFLVTLLDTVLDPGGRWLPGNARALRSRLRTLASAEMHEALHRPLGLAGWADWSVRDGWKGTVLIYCRTTESARLERERWTNLIGAVLNIRDANQGAKLQAWNKLSLLYIHFQKK